MPAKHQETDRIQRVVARMVATSPAGVNLLLIGGFRYRLLDHSERFSVDIDYHWGADLEAKQQELLRLCRRMVIGQVRRELGYEGSAYITKGPDADSPNARFLDLRFWKHDHAVEIPIEITRIVCLDPPIIRTAEGTAHVTASDADLIESKIIAILNRLYIQHRDLVDLFLYASKVRPDSPARLKQKLDKLQINPERVVRRLQDLEDNREYHASVVQKVIEEQVNPTVVQQLNAGGGGRTVFDSALEILRKTCRP